MDIYLQIKFTKIMVDSTVRSDMEWPCYDLCVNDLDSAGLIVEQNLFPFHRCFIVSQWCGIWNSQLQIFLLWSNSVMLLIARSVCVCVTQCLSVSCVLVIKIECCVPGHWTFPQVWTAVKSDKSTNGCLFSCWQGSD